MATVLEEIVLTITEQVDKEIYAKKRPTDTRCLIPHAESSLAPMSKTAIAYVG